MGVEIGGPFPVDVATVTVLPDDGIPIYRYTLTLTDGTTVTADALGCEESGPWLVFNDHLGTVLSIRHSNVASFARGLQVASAPVENL